MRKISIKIGLLFFCLIFTMEVCLFFLLHQKIAHSRIDEQLSSLVTRGNNHRDVLETYYNEETIHHIALMEVKSDTEVVITNKQGKVIISSAEINQFQSLLNVEKKDVPRSGKVIEDNWKSEPYIATVTPFKGGVDKGYVYMFQDTSQLKELINQLNRHFLIAGIATAFVTAIIILILSRIIARPLIKMKEATKELSQGNFSIQLENKSNDELGELAESIQLLSNELNHLKTERNEFLASISHELRTPLTYIKGYAEVAKREHLSLDERLDYLIVITEEATKLTTLVTELMELAQLDNNTFTIQKEMFYVSDSLKKISQKILPAFKQEAKKLLIICPENIQIYADPIRFEQIILNLLENARKYSSKGTITTTEISKKDTEIKISIHDKGKGIPDNDIPFIFERFYRVDKSRSRELGGTGLGLSIVKELIDAHNWQIEVSSEINKGTTFTIIARGDRDYA
ncbi:HAMP domain-containing histidine kinase [Siminovitchia terrae]|uniref:histidine kinase n=1 Tax=Siminovitchia terrae TaxID=1914933 RepID=A0A429X5H5_SIMTE|nr:HAMP domain-containing sensor histidine kinase [Siminovitchia terrae]RST58688.1 HAMP domain-containing histidine kinase [Siminovitchia terrae]